MDYGQQCGGSELRAELYIPRHQTLHFRLDLMAGRLVGTLIWFDGQKPGLREWFNVDNRPGSVPSDDRRNHSIDANPRRPGKIRIDGAYYHRVQPNQPPLYWYFNWLVYTMNADSTVTWSENYSIACDSTPQFDVPDWRAAFGLDFQLFWEQPAAV